MSRTRVLAVLVLAAVVAVSAYSLPLAEWTTQLAERARGTGAWGVALFFTAYVISTVAFLPGSVLTLAAGFAYGPLWGVAIASPASVIGSTCAFLLGRTLLRPWAEARVGASPRVRAIDAAVSCAGVVPGHVARNGDVGLPRLARARGGETLVGRLRRRHDADGSLYRRPCGDRRRSRDRRACRQACP